MGTIAVVGWLLVAAATPTGTISTDSGMATFTARTVYDARINLERDARGTWRGRVNRRLVEFSVAHDAVNGDDELTASGSGVSMVFIHHEGFWYCKGWIFGTKISVIWPDGEALDGWRGFHFGGIAAKPNPPIVPFVLGLYLASSGQLRHSLGMGFAPHGRPRP